MPKICIDAFNISLSKGTGIATYGRNLLNAVSAIGCNAEVLFGTRGASKRHVTESILAEGEREDKISVKKSRRFFETINTRFGRSAYIVAEDKSVIWDERNGGRPNAQRFWSSPNLYYYSQRAYDAYGSITPVDFNGERPDIFHLTTPLPLFGRGVVNICTFHDIIPLVLPHSTTDNKLKYKNLCTTILNKYDHIVSVSEKTKEDIVHTFGISEEKITTTYQDVYVPADVVGMSDAEIDEALVRIFGLDYNNYYIYYGAIEPKKNVGRIIEAYLLSGSQRPLVIVGGRRWLEARELGLYDQIKSRGVSGANRIQIYDYMPQKLLMQLVKGARATIFPSLYEGFGLPVVESMVLGTPVITSTAGSLPEIAGGAAIMVDPYDVRALASSISLLDSDERAASELVSKGLKNAERFTSKQYADRLSAVYKRFS